MQVSVESVGNLERRMTFRLPAENLESNVGGRLREIARDARIKGFRPGKVPVSHLRKTYGRSLMAEIVNQIINETPRKVIADRNERSAMQPEIAMSEDEAEAEKVLGGGTDFRFTLRYETLPSFDVKDTSGIAIERPVVEVADEEVEEQVKRIAAGKQAADEAPSDPGEILRGQETHARAGADA